MAPWGIPSPRHAVLPATPLGCPCVPAFVNCQKQDALDGSDLPDWMDTRYRTAPILIGLTHLNLSLRAQRGNLVARASTQLRKSYLIILQIR